VALFIVDLAFDDPAIHSQAKIGILAGSLLSAVMGWVIFRMAWDRGGVCAPPEAEPAEELAELLSMPVGPEDHVRGPENARVTIVEYGDFECPYCGRIHPILEELRKKHRDVRVVFRHFPLRTLHPRAAPAAIVSEAAADRGRFWEMHDILYDNQRFLTDADLEHYAAELNVDPWSDVAGHVSRVALDEASGRDSGVRGTPTLFLNGVRYQGPLDLNSISRAVEELRESP
jgi:protein-disulfide isomerase